MEHPCLSVIVPVCNGERFIREALSSILDQHYPCLEILVVDDGSTDTTRQKVLEFEGAVTYMYQTNQGPAAARNTGLERARGELIGFLDADDLWSRGRLVPMIRKLEADTSWDIVVGHTLVRPLPACGVGTGMAAQPQIMPLFGSALFRKRIFRRVGLLDASLRYSEDHDWFMRAKENKARIVAIKEVTHIHRVHASNMTRGMDWKRVDIIKVLKKSLDRRRQVGKNNIEELPQLSDFLE